MNNSIQYEIVSPFTNGIAIIRKNNLYGAILSGGKELIQPQYQYMSNFVDGYAKAIKNGRTITLDLSGREYIETSNGLFEIPDDVYDIQECGINLFRYAIQIKTSPYDITPQLKWGVMNENQEILINPEFEYIHEYINNTSKACKIVNNRYGTVTEWFIITNKSTIGDETFEIEPAIVEEDELIITRPCIDSNVKHAHNDNVNYFSIRTNSSCEAIIYYEGKRYVLNKDIYRVFPLAYGHYIVQNKDGKFGAINRYGLIVSHISNLSRNSVLYPHAVTLPNGKEILLPKDITTIYTFDGQYAKFKTSKGMGILDSNGNILAKDIPFLIAGFNADNNTFCLRRLDNNNSWVGLFDITHKRIIKPNYTQILSFNENGAEVVIKDEGTYKLDKLGRCLIQNNGIEVSLPDSFSTGSSGINNISIVRNNDLYGLLDLSKNEMLVECKYSHIEYNNLDIFICKRISRIKQPKRWGEDQPDIELIQYDVFNNFGYNILSNLEQVIPISSTRFIVKRNGLYGIISDGNEILIQFENISVQNLGYNRLAITNKDKQTRILDYDGNIISERFITAYSNIVVFPYERNKTAKVQWLDYECFIDIDGNLVCGYNDSIVKVPTGYDWCFGFNGKIFRCLESFAEYELYENMFTEQHKIGTLIKPDGTKVIYRGNKLQEVPSSILGVLCTTNSFSIVSVKPSKEKSDFYNCLYGITDKSGNWFIENISFPKFGMLSNNIMVIHGGGYPKKQALLNYKKGIITEFRFASSELSKDRKIIIVTVIDEAYSKSKKWDEKDRYSIELLDLNFEVRFSMEDARIISQVIDKEQRCLYVIEKISTHKYGVVNHLGKVIIGFEFSFIQQFDTESFEVSYSYDCKGLIGLDGRAIIPIKYSTIIKNSSDSYIGIEHSNKPSYKNFPF